MSNSGHLVVVQADMTSLAADAFLIPCDSYRQVSGRWRPFIEPGSKAQPSADWFKVEDVELENGFGVIPPRVIPGASGPDAIWGIRMLLDTVGVGTIEEMVDRAIDAVQEANRLAAGRTHGGRVRQLIALPVLGVGQGNYPGQRARVMALDQAERKTSSKCHVTASTDGRSTLRSGSSMTVPCLE